MTVLNDPSTLLSILTWGEGKSLTPAVGGDPCKERNNPILVSCQQDFKRCMEHLYHHGYRMKDFNDKDEVEYEEDDQIKQFLRFQAASNIHYLSLEFTEHQALQNKDGAPELGPEEIKKLEKMDPFQKACKMMEDADKNMDDFQGSSELKCNYVLIKKKLEAFLAGLLTQCKGMEEVRTILDYNKEDDDDDDLDDADTNWQMALFKGYKDLVSHPNFQQYLWRKMTGDATHHLPAIHRMPLDCLTQQIPHIKRGLWNIKNIPLTIFTFIFCYPFVVLADLFRKGDIMFVNPKALKERRLKKKNLEKLQGDEEGSPKDCFDYFRKRMHIPMFRMIPYFAIQVAYLILLCISIWNPADPVVAFADLLKHGKTEHLWAAIFMIIAFIIAVNFLVDDIIHLFRPQHYQSFWSIFSLITHLLLVGGAFLAGVSYCGTIKKEELANLSGNDPVNVGMVMLSFGAGLEFFRILQWLVLLENTGPMVLCVIQVIKDALRMVSIYVILFFAHSIAFWSLYKPFREQNDSSNSTNYVLVNPALKTQRGMESTLFWRIIASTDGEVVSINNTRNGDDFSLEFSHLMGLVLWGVYQIIIYVLMLNLLIAIMNTSYSELWQNAQREWKYSKSIFQVRIHFSISAYFYNFL